MNLIRPELAEGLRRWSEVLASLALSGFGLWTLQSYDRFIQILGAAIIVTGLGLALLAWRRLRFQRDTEAPGIVQVVEGQISYFGPETGGFVGLGQVVELHLVDHGTAWRLVTPEEELSIPVAAQGADALFDAFAQLPGLRMSDVLTALDHPQPTRVLWLHASRRPTRLAKS
ncbi:hypothetical protein ROE7235_02862 [Roseibaca ekhonensis]|jgi:hypothetical protein|uniref:Uncharacterized protein n=1 Tax=Roseinatronobacter ekhonensis TaxID=254356 RepID=A0A3B0MWK2_9RHOB|nr:hypothetical protein [Roseibaca ekhonensis]SUZ33094.1 hypothetical protein ROE7235_02862 [Roseibaca ekhonensis]